MSNAVESAGRLIADKALAILDSGACAGTCHDAGTYTPDTFLAACLRAGGAHRLTSLPGPGADSTPGPMPGRAPDPMPGDVARYADAYGSEGWVVCVAPNRGVVCRTGWNGLAVIALDVRPRTWLRPAPSGADPAPPGPPPPPVADLSKA